MTAINIACQPRHRCLHVVTDGAHYQVSGVVLGIGPKTFNVPSWPAVIATRGPSVATSLLGYALSIEFPSFDAMTAGIEEKLPEIVDSMNLPDDGPLATFELTIAGWSRARDRPESYYIRNTDEPPPGYTREQIAALKAQDPTIVWPDAFELARLPDTVEGPIVSDATKVESGYGGIDVDDDPDVVVRDMLHCIETQRRQIDDGYGFHIVGGFAQLSTVTPDSISQRMLTRWPEDQIGQMIEPAPIDWSRWRAEHLQGATASNVTHLNRQQRRAMSRAQR